MHVNKRIEGQKRGEQKFFTTYAEVFRLLDGGMTAGEVGEVTGKGIRQVRQARERRAEIEMGEPSYGT